MYGFSKIDSGKGGDDVDVDAAFCGGNLFFSWSAKSPKSVSLKKCSSGSAAGPSGTPDADVSSSLRSTLKTIGKPWT